MAVDELVKWCCSEELIGDSLSENNYNYSWLCIRFILAIFQSWFSGKNCFQYPRGGNDFCDLEERRKMIVLLFACQLMTLSQCCAVATFM